MLSPARAISIGKLSQIVFTFVLLSSLALFITVKAHAQTNTYTPPVAPIQTDSHLKTQQIFLDIGSAFMCFMTGYDMLHPQTGCLGLNPATMKLEPQTPQSQQQLGGVLGGLSSMIGATYQKPTTTGVYFQTLASNFGIAKKTHAQGTGFTRLDPLQDMWLNIRNITFILMLLLFVFVGFGIMLRLKIDPRTVMSIQNQLPKIVITLVLVSFSFAISGFLIDAMWFVTYSGVNILVPDEAACLNPKNGFDEKGNIKDPEQIELRQPDAIKKAVGVNLINNPIVFVNELFGNTTGCQGFDVPVIGLGTINIDGIAGIVGNGSSTLGNIVATTVTQSLFGLEDTDCKVSGGEFAIHKTDFLGVPYPAVEGPDVTLGACAQAILHGVVRAIATFLMSLILLMAILLALVRLWFALLRAYAYVLVGTILSPIYIGAGLLPAGKFGFSAWIRFMLAHLSVFPVTAFFFVLARIVSSIPMTGAEDIYFLPPFVGNPSVAGNIQAVLVVAILLITPEVLNITRQAFHSEPNKMISGAIFGGFKAGLPAASLATKPIKRQFAFDPTKGQFGPIGWRVNQMRNSRGLKRFVGTSGNPARYAEWVKNNPWYRPPGSRTP